MDKKAYNPLKVINTKSVVRKFIKEFPKRRKGKWSFDCLTKTETILKR